MKHYVAFKFKNGSFGDEILRAINKTYQELFSKVKGFDQFDILENCITRDSNFDLMISMSLSDNEILEQYLTHPDHVELVTYLTPHIEKLMTFDCE